MSDRDSLSADEKVGFELDGLEVYKLGTRYFEINYENQSIAVSIPTAVALRDWLNKVLP